VKYKNESSEPFNWLYLDEAVFETATFSYHLKFKLLARGENYDYLAKLIN